MALQELIINDGISYNILREILLSMLCNNGIAVAKHIFLGSFLLPANNIFMMLCDFHDTFFFISDYLNLYEHQSTYSPNAPLRFLI